MRASIFGLAAIAALAASGVAFAQDQGPPPGAMAPAMNFRQACGADMANLCPTAQTPQDKRACVKANLNKASADCNTFFANHKAMRSMQMQMQMQGGGGSPNDMQGPPPGQDQGPPPGSGH